MNSLNIGSNKPANFDRIAEGFKLDTNSGRPSNNSDLYRFFANLHGIKTDISPFECGGDYCAGSRTYAARSERPGSTDRSGNNVTVSNVSDDFRFRAEQNGKSYEVIGTVGGRIKINLKGTSGSHQRSVEIPYQNFSANLSKGDLQVLINGKALGHYFL
jgi:hypothetical protein